MDTPEPKPAGAARAQALIRGVVQGAGRRNLLILALFAILVVAAGRTEPSPNEPGRATAAELIDPAPTALPDLSLPTQARGTPEAVALDNLLSRFDVLLRLLEVRAVRTGRDTPTLTELRTLRATVYDVSRRALIETDSSHAAPR